MDDTWGESPAVSQPRKRNLITALTETFVKSSPFVIAVVQWDASMPVLVPCYSSSATLSAIRLLSFVLIKTKPQLVKAHTPVTCIQVLIRRLVQDVQRDGCGQNGEPM